MRLLIYLLALMSGFSAAEAARGEISPASSVAQSAIAAAESLVAQDQAKASYPVDHIVHAPLYIDQPAAPIFATADTPVKRHDLTHE
jgi:hypothetical protein